MRAFQVAKEASFAWNYTKTMIQTVVMWSIFLVFGPMLVSWIAAELGFPTFEAQRGAGIALFIAGGSLGLISGYTMARIGEGTPLPLDSARKLVIAGPYTRVRNPMALAGTVQSFAVGVFLGSPAVFAATMFSAALWNWIVRPAEEADLVERFGQPFIDYRDAVRCWIPNWNPYSSPTTSEKLP